MPVYKILESFVCSQLNMKLVIDLWFESLECGKDDYKYYWSILDHIERIKAQRFVRDFERRRYVISHGKLRQILASYLHHQSPEKIAFAVQDYGKPFLIDEENNGIKFNLAHSGNYLAVGVCHDCNIGVDIEVWTDTVDYVQILNLCFVDSERRFWYQLPSGQKQEFFYRLWTRKESFAKAVGLGLSLDISQVETALQGTSRFLSLPRGCGAPQNWSLVDLDLFKHLSGAITAPVHCAPKINYKRLR